MLHLKYLFCRPIDSAAVATAPAMVKQSRYRPGVAQKVPGS